jgi:pimeloyl-ACP methyl ester carboxylesterase
MTAEGQRLHYGYAKTPRGQIHYAEAGSGPTLLLLGESPRSHRHFRKAVPLLAPHFRTIAIDTPGYGNSHTAPSPVTVPAVAACVVEFLDSMSIDRANVFGVHTGNKLGASLAADWPDRVNRLVLAGYTHSIIPDREARNAAILPIFERYAPRFAPSADGAHLARQWLATHIYANGLWWPPQLLTAKTIVDDDIDGIEAQVIDYLLGWRSVVPMYQAVFDFDLADAFSRIEAPTMVLEFVTPQEKHLGPQAEAICSTMKRATAATLDVTYLYALENEAGKIVKTIVPFLSAQSIGPSTLDAQRVSGDKP